MSQNHPKISINISDMKLEIMGVKTKINDKQRKYIEKKIKNLEKYIPRLERESVRAEVRIKSYKVKEYRQIVCEVAMRLPHAILVVNETGSEIPVMIDNIENRLKLAMKKHKEKRYLPRLRQRAVT